MTFKRTLASAAVAVIGAGSLAFAAPALAATQTTASATCQTKEFPEFSWDNFTIDAEAVTDGTETAVTLTFSQLPGVVPVAVKAVPMVGSVKGTINGTAVEFTGSSTIDVGASAPVDLPAVTARIPGDVAEVDVAIASHLWTVTAYGADFPTVCPSSGTFAAAIDDLPVEGGTLPTEEPSPSASPSPSATPSATPSESPSESPSDVAKAGVPSKGSVVFDCMLSAPFNTPFDYEADVVVDGMRPTADSTDVSLAASFTQIPGLAPVPITGGKMRIIVKGDAGGEAFELTGSSVVNVGENEPVPVPQLSASVDTDAEDVELTMDSFRFEFDPMDNLEISADCTFKSGEMSTMTIGVGELEEETPDENGGSGGDAGGDSTTTLPRTGGADAMPVIALWAGALGVAGAGLLVWLPRQRRATN